MIGHRKTIDIRRPNAGTLNAGVTPAVIHILITGLMIAAVAGCGMKKPPVPPPEYRPPAAADVRYSMEGDRLLLSWQVPETGGQGAPIQGCKVFRAARNIGEDACPGCPSPFVAVADRPLDTADQNRQTHRETLTPGFLYSYKIACYTRRGSWGRETQPITIQFDGENTAP
jgi:hypothetical protein